MRTIITTLLILFSFQTISAQTTIFSENMGTPSTTTTIANNIFQNNGLLSYSNGAQSLSADVRTTSTSSSYASASAGGNVYFSSTSGTYGFSIEGINASNYHSLSLQFGYKKESSTTHASFSVDYWNGSSWVTLASAASELFNEAANASAVWYLSKTLSLPTDAQINGLKIRFVKTGIGAIRIDDVKLTAFEVLPTVINNSVSSVTSVSATFGGEVTATGGSNIIETGIVFSSTSINSNPLIGGIGVNKLVSTNPNSGLGVFYNDSGVILMPNVQYSYNAYAIKSTGGVGYGSQATFYTLAVTPSAPIVDTPSATSLNIAINNDSNSSSTTYAILETSTGNYVQIDGNLGVTAVYQTATSWGTKIIIGLSPSTTYIFKTVAKNGNGVITQESGSSSIATLAMPTINTSGTLSALSTTYGTASTYTSFMFSGENLTGDVMISAPAGFEISITANGITGYATTQTVSPISGGINNTTVYVRLAASTPFGTYSGNFQLVSNLDSISENLTILSSDVFKREVLLQGVTVVNKAYDGNTNATLIGTSVLQGVISNDSEEVFLNSSSVQAHFVDANIGTGKTVVVNGYSLTGFKAVNYRLNQPLEFLADIMPNNNSDIIFNSSSPTSSNENIHYINYQGTTLTSTNGGPNGSIGVMGFYLRDGGAGLNDLDDLPTELTAITFSVTNPGSIRSARLFIGNSPRGVPVSVNGASTISFTNLTNIIAGDNSQLAINLRITFNSNIIDKEQIQFKIVSATTNQNGSNFSESDAGGAISSVNGDINRIQVIADRLGFNQQPPLSLYQSSIMFPAPTVIAKDINGNIDLDFNGIVSVTSSGTLETSPQYSFPLFGNGIATFENIKHTDSGIGFQLIASCSGFIEATSNLFDIEALTIPIFESVEPICVGGIINNLPTTSINGIIGTWSPQLNNYQTTNYIFTPNPGQNAAITNLLITVNQLITPTFNPIGTITSGAALSPLPLTSLNGISGSWSPNLNNTTTTTYTFTSNPGQCASNTVLTITVDNSGNGGNPPNQTYPTSPTGTSAEVGITEGQLSVSLTGGASYNIPIATPPGINGITPQISLSYNSQDGNGIAGYGWNILGISSIDKIPSTKFHDNNIDPIDYDSSDRLSLDGQRLILKSGTYGANGSVYETENFSNIKITAYGVHPQSPSIGPSYFVVQYPDGSIAHYGSGNSKTITKWAITYWENPQGVRINYKYLSSVNSLRIFEVSYGRVGEPNEDVSNVISFSYRDRQRLEQAYFGQSVVMDKILDKIYVQGFGVQFKRYELSHDLTSLGYERLTSITEKTGDGSKSLNPTIFNYENTSDSISYQSSTTSLSLAGISVLNSATVSGDFDGDGKMDFALYPNASPFEMTKFWVFTKIDGSSSNMGYGPFTIGKFEELFASNWLSHNDKLMPMNGITSIQFGGNQIGDITFNTYSVHPYEIYIQNSKIISFPNYDTGESVPEYNFCNYSPIKTIPKRYINGDFNGDGITDVIAIEKSTTFYKFGACNCCGPTGNFYSVSGQAINYTGGKTYFVDLDRRLNQTTPVLLGNITINNDSKVYVADANGDGKSDIYVFNEGLVRVYSINSSNQMVQLWSLTDSNISINSNKTILLGDYNGDGKTDFIIPKGQGYFDWYKYMCTGGSFVKTTEFYSGFNYSANDALNTRYLIPTDFNNDGKTDLVRITSSRNQNNTYGQIVVNCIKNINGQFNFQDSNYYYVGHSGQQAELDKYALPIFYNSNQPNRKMEVACIYNNKIHYFKSEKDFNKEKLLKVITTGNGVKETITYSPLVQESCPYNCFYAYTPAVYTENYPNFDIEIAPAFQVVTKLEKQSSTVYKKQLYSYYGGTSNFEGLGFLGFKSIAKTNWFNDSTQPISTISKFDTNLRGAQIESYTVLGIVSPVLQLGTNDPYISKTFNTYNFENGNFVNPLLNNKVFKLKLTSTQTYNGLENTSSDALFEYDEYNNPIKNTTIIKEGNTIVQTTISDLAYDSQINGLEYYVGRINSKAQSVTVNGDVMTGQELYSYNSLNLVSQIRKKGHQTNFLTEDNLYDDFGNLTKKTITAVGLVPRETNYEYDSTGRFMTKSIDIEGLETTYDYSPFSGVLNYEINHYGLKTSFEYDKWYKKTKETNYLLKNKIWTYTKDNEKTLILKVSDEGNQVQEIYDDLGRKIKYGVKNINGIWSYSDIKYDIYDRITNYSEPYFGSSPSKWNQNQYDEYGRIISNALYTGKITTTTYNGLVSTVSDGFLSKTSTKDALGNIIQMIDSPGGTINYTYFANNNLKTSTYNGITTTITQDGWGRKLTLDDPSAGLYSYTYNELGEMSSETTPNGNTQYDLNDFGKLQTKLISGNQTNTNIMYEYNSATKLLDTEQSTDVNGNIFTKNYFYDSNKRLNKIIESDSSNQFQFEKRYEYDSFGRIYREFSGATNISDGKNSSKWIKHTYLNGYHWQVLDDATNAMLWQVDEVNENGDLVTAHYGNSIGRESHTYDQYGLPETASFRTINGIYASSIPFLSLTTVFNAQRGVLNSRSNSMFDWIEMFDHDNLDRLIEYTNGNGQQVFQTYNSSGTINTNVVGEYAYTISNKPYQVSSVTLINQNQIDYYTNRNPQEVSYNAFKAPISINENGHERIDFDYNQSLTRAVQYYGSTDIDKLDRPFRKYYSSDGTMEIKRDMVTGDVDFILYIGGDGYSSPIILKSDGNSEAFYFLHRDYLGSILAITNDQGQVVEKRLFDAWGELIKYENSNGITTIPIQTGVMFLDRGYTGHEHLFGVGLINMNGRLYDPKLHRFLAPDNFVQDPYNSQNFNRYGYVLNNPLMLVDYSGESFSSWWNKNWKTVVTVAASVAVATVIVLSAGTATPLVFALAGGAAGFTGGFLGTALNGGSLGDSLFNGLIGGAVGFTMGGIGAGVASLAPAGAFWGALYGGTTNAFLGGFGSMMMGGDFSDGAIIGGITGALFGGYGGYVAAKGQGLNPWTGATIRPKVSTITLQPQGTVNSKAEISVELPQNSNTPLYDEMPPSENVYKIISGSDGTKSLAKPIDPISFSDKIDLGKQGKHIFEHNNYIAGKSILDVDAQTLLSDYHAGIYTESQVINSVKIRVNFGKVIGTYLDYNGNAFQTTKAILVNSKSGVHIIPAAP